MEKTNKQKTALMFSPLVQSHSLMCVLIPLTIEEEIKCILK